MITDLTEWLETAIDDHELLAKRILDESYTDGIWTFDYQAHPVPRIVGASWESTITDGIWNCTDDMDSCDETRMVVTSEGEHIALHDPAAVLRRCQADRKILGLHRSVQMKYQRVGEDPFGCPICHLDAHEPVVFGGGYCDTILALAEGYGYQETT